MHYFALLSILPPLLIVATQSARSEQTILKTNEPQSVRDAFSNSIDYSPFTEWNALTYAGTSKSRMALSAVCIYPMSASALLRIFKRGQQNALTNKRIGSNGSPYLFAPWNPTQRGLETCFQDILQHCASAADACDRPYVEGEKHA